MTLPVHVLIAALIATFLLSLVACEIVRRLAIRRALLDPVNERSLHAVPTPRLGGVAIVVATLLAAMMGWNAAGTELHVIIVLCTGVAAVGLVDDVRPLSARMRIAVQVTAAVAFLQLIGTPPLLIARGTTLSLPSLATSGLLVIWIVGVLNIYNFMDGLDGLAGCQTISAAACIAALLGAGSSLTGFALALGASAAGFLAHNFPPARIFMGDAGSTFIGMAFATLVVLGMHHGVPITESALPLAPFLLDGTFTIFRRASRRERIWEAHRSHLYQRAVQMGLGHREVLLVYLAWIAVAAGASLLSSMGPSALVSAWLAVLAGLVLVWQWVTRLESDRSKLA